METNQPPSRQLQILVLTGLIVVIAVIAVAFVRSRSSVPPLPIVAEVPVFTLTNQNNTPISLSDLKGHVWVADIIFTRCPMQCLRMTKNMAAVQKEVPTDGSIKFVSLTADPGFDNPGILKTYGQRFGADQNWHFLTGSKSNIYTLAMNGLKLAVDETKPEERQSIDDLFIHSNKFILIDKEGRIRAWFDGDNAEMKPQIVATIQQLLKDNK